MVEALGNEKNVESMNYSDNMKMEIMMDTFEHVHDILMHWSP